VKKNTKKLSPSVEVLLHLIYARDLEVNDFVPLTNLGVITYHHVSRVKQDAVSEVIHCQVNKCVTVTYSPNDLITVLRQKT
jgi:hypothetical protein